MASSLPRGWFARPAAEVAADLLGRELIRTLPTGERRRVRIVETEAYEADDPASHSFRGPTARCASMFGAPGHLYVYRIYGLHHCLNVVTGPRGHGAAVLLRAAEPLEGTAGMARARGSSDVRSWCSGPAKLAQALAVDLGADGTDLLRSGPIRLAPGHPVSPAAIERGARIGVRHAADVPWRYWEAGSPWVSRRSSASRS